MGDFEKHLSITREKLSALKEAYQKRRYTVVGDLATKVVEQLVEADAARDNEHFGLILIDMNILTEIFQ